ncbi:MAG TPA: peptidylprolyl isomerase [Burkholderiaceae bacterium]|nr:peptidylprolyl isomerase [Burkholderiaceae bacterium]
MKLNSPTLVAALFALLAASAGFAQRVPAAGQPATPATAAPEPDANKPALVSPVAASGVRQFGSLPRIKPLAKSADYIVAVVNSESVTDNEVKFRVAKMQQESIERGGAQPTAAELRKQALDALVEERVLVTYARDNGVKVDDAEVDRAIGNIASSNKMSIEQLRDRLRQQGVDYNTFKSGIRDQITIERIREREVVNHIRVTDTEIADYIAKMRGGHTSAPQVDIAQILITVPDKATPVVEAERKARAEAALARVRNGEPFEQVAREMSEDANKAKGGEMGSRTLDKYPDLFVDAIKDVKVGGTSGVVRSGAGFHVLKVVSRGEESGLTVTQTRVRHIVLRPSAQLGIDAVGRRILDFRQQIASGAKTFEEIARQYSEDGSAQAGGDLGWASPGSFVPEFEEAMDKLPIAGLSGPVRSRFGVHLIQVLDRRETTVEPKQLREQATNALKEQKFDPAYAEWVADLRAKAFIEYRDPPI